jgi:hypothetical protein
MKPPKKPRVVPRPTRLKGVEAVTICVAALAADFKAIVCVADKALAYGDQIQWDSDGSKIIKINPSGTLLMFSGEETAISKVTTALHAKGTELWGNGKTETIQVCEDEYKHVLDALVEAKFLTPRLLTRQDYVAAVSGQQINSYAKSLAEDIANYELDCDLLICGFDYIKSPFIIDVKSPGIAADMTMTGFQAVGCAWEKAVARLLFSEHKRTHSIARSLYDAFDAKAFAEMSAGVGYEWDAVVITEHGFHDVPKDIKELIEKVWSKFNRSPFEKFNAKEDIPGPPRDWKQQLDDFCNELLAPKRPSMRQKPASRQ